MCLISSTHSATHNKNNSTHTAPPCTHQQCTISPAPTGAKTTDDTKHRNRLYSCTHRVHLDVANLVHTIRNITRTPAHTPSLRAHTNSAQHHHSLPVLKPLTIQRTGKGCIASHTTYLTWRVATTALPSKHTHSPTSSGNHTAAKLTMLANTPVAPPPLLPCTKPRWPATLPQTSAATGQGCAP